MVRGVYKRNVPWRCTKMFRATYTVVFAVKCILVDTSRNANDTKKIQTLPHDLCAKYFRTTSSINCQVWVRASRDGVMVVYLIGDLHLADEGEGG